MLKKQKWEVKAHFVLYLCKNWKYGRHFSNKEALGFSTSGLRLYSQSVLHENPELPIVKTLKKNTFLRADKRHLRMFIADMKWPPTYFISKYIYW